MISQSACLSMLALTVTISRTQNRSSVLLIRIVPLFSVSILARSTYLHLFQTPPNGRRTWIILKSRDSSRTNSPKDCRARFTSDTKVSDVNCDNRRNGIVIRNSSSGDCTDERTRSVIFIYSVMSFDIEVNRIFKLFKMFGRLRIPSPWKVTLYLMDQVLNFDIFCSSTALIV